MANVVEMGELFAPEEISAMFNKVRGKSTVAKLSSETPIPFTGTEIFTFSLDKEVDIVAESGKKTNGGITIEPVKMAPVKIEYGARISDEFMYAATEKKLQLLAEFIEGYAKKAARGLDIMAMHGLNPRTGTRSNLISHYFDQVENTVTYTAANGGDEAIEDAIALIEDYDISGLALSKTLATAMGKEQDGHGNWKFPTLRWGGSPDRINNIAADVNSTVSFGESDDLAIVGDFENAFKWGYSKKLPLEIIEYGDPDNSGKDLKGYNQIYVRLESYLGWGILDQAAFSRVVKPAEGE